MKNLFFSVITPIYNTPIFKLKRLYESLINQTYSNWEWVLVDDSSDGYTEAFDYIKDLKDDKITIYKNDHNIGSIGYVKNKAFFLAGGDILVEVDHDDELINTCLENLNISYNYSSEIGFVYGHATEIYENNEGTIDYGDVWGMEYGRYSKTTYKGKDYKVAMAGNINPKTIRHITGVPNHVRSWRKDVYYKLGGHNCTLQVADDYELIIRTFLETKIAKMNVFSYIQYFELKTENNTQFIKNTEIHELVPKITELYNDEIHKRFIELNINDYVWNDGFVNLNAPNPEIEQFANIIIPEELLKNQLKPIMSKENLYAYSRVYDINSILEYKKTEHYSNFIKWLVRLTNCQSYLELGVEYGTNIIEIKDIVNLCVGVDINVVDILDKGNIMFFQMTTDDFFDKFSNTFDIIFIDANHSFEQVKKDFNNSLSVLNKFGIIILHDTDPITEDLLTKEHCNDSYKIVDYIESLENLNIITLPIQETGLTLVMRKNDRRVLNFLKK